MSNDPPRGEGKASPQFWLLALFFVVLWVAGGASRADVLGQPIVRSFAWALLIAFLLFVPSIEWQKIRAPLLLLSIAALLALVQLVPLPPAIWTSLPGRQLLTGAADAAQVAQPWRPISISPSGTSNALGSLIVPGVVLLLGAGLSRHDHYKMVMLILVLLLGSVLIGLAQFAGSSYENPFINSTQGEVAGNFANRNHFALFLAIGSVLALGLAMRGQKIRSKTIGAFGVVLLFFLLSLATGSRAGMLLNLIAVPLALLVFRARIRRELEGVPRAIVASAGIVALALSAGAIGMSIKLGRAVAVDRAGQFGGEGDLRSPIWSVVGDMIHRYFPFGTGFGTFDPAFRISEPDSMLGLRYVNQAHNDWLQVILEAGVPGLALLILFTVWLVLAAISVWRPTKGGESSHILGRCGTVILLLVMLASIVDYPARTPMIMAVVALSAIWVEAGRVRLS